MQLWWYRLNITTVFRRLCQIQWTTLGQNHMHQSLLLLSLILQVSVAMPCLFHIYTILESLNLVGWIYLFILLGLIGGARAGVQLRSFLGELGCVTVSNMFSISQVYNCFDEQGVPMSNELVNNMLCNIIFIFY